MPTYVMSDLHGEYDRFREMLREISFSDADTLYILGDVVDRGPDGVRILTEIMGRENIRMILGNHEYLCLRYFASDATETERRRWNRNGNYPTLIGLDALTPAERKALLAFLRSLPDHVRVTAGGRSWLLVHGGWADTTYDRVWRRPALEDDPDIGEGTTLVIGHTPVCEYLCRPCTDEDEYVYSHELTRRGDHFRIFHAPHFIDLDCCCGYGFSAGRLACLRLDDGAEFYV